MFQTEEQKGYASKRLQEISEIRARLEQLSDQIEVPADLMEDLEGLSFLLTEPVAEEILNDVVQSKFARDSSGMDWPDVRDLYGVPDLTKFNDLISRLHNNPSIDDVEALLSELDHLVESLEKVIEDRGGDSDDRLVEIVNKIDIDKVGQWHYDLFGSIEVQSYALALNMLSERFGIPVHELNTEDVGCGQGRCFHQLAELYAKGLEAGLVFSRSVSFSKHSPEQLLEFASGYHAIDISEKNILQTRRLIKGIIQDQQFDDSKVMRGDFHDEEAQGPEPGTIHFGFSMMRTMLHNNTEEHMVSVLRREARNLVPGTEDRPGGMLLIDTVKMRRKEPSLREGLEVESSLDDLKKLIHSAIQRECGKKSAPSG